MLPPVSGRRLSRSVGGGGGGGGVVYSSLNAAYLLGVSVCVGLIMGLDETRHKKNNSFASLPYDAPEIKQK